MVYDLGTEQSLDIIFAGIMIGGLPTSTEGMTEEQAQDYNDVVAIKRKNFNFCFATFNQEFPLNIFQDSFAFYYEVFKTLGVKVFKRDQLETIIQQNRDLILDSPYIDTSKYTVTVNGGRSQEDEIILGFQADILEKFDRLSNTPVERDEFNSAVRIFKEYYIAQRSLEIAQNCTMILSNDGFLERQPGKRSKTLRGLEDQRAYYNREQSKLRIIEGGIESASKCIDEDWLRKEIEHDEERDADFLTSFGIRRLDDAMGGLRKRRMYGILGAPKGGKTRFANYLVGRLLDAGYNVTVWPLEGTEDEWTAIQVSYIMNEQFGIKIPSKIVLEKRYGYAEAEGVNAEYIRKEITAAKTILAMGKSSGDKSKPRGRLNFLNGTAYVEDFLDTIEAEYMERPFDVLVIDQVVNILSKTKMGKVERISQAYIQLHDYIQNKRPCCMIGPAQLKQEVINYIRSHPDETLDVTSGGESAETIRTPDEVIGLMSTKEERNAGMMKLYHVASRHGDSFDDHMVRAELGWVHFGDDDSLNAAMG